MDPCEWAGSGAPTDQSLQPGVEPPGAILAQGALRARAASGMESPEKAQVQALNKLLEVGQTGPQSAAGLLLPRVHRACAPAMPSTRGAPAVATSQGPKCPRPPGSLPDSSFLGFPGPLAASGGESGLRVAVLVEAARSLSAPCYREDRSRAPACHSTDTPESRGAQGHLVLGLQSETASGDKWVTNVNSDTGWLAGSCPMESRDAESGRLEGTSGKSPARVCSWHSMR